MTQEDIEEEAEGYALSKLSETNGATVNTDLLKLKNAFIAGAKWALQQMRAGKLK